ncbi:LysE family translocator [Sphingobium nicotianae]|uniref:LysE family transporter n=1 Tax=Sphingobium nicotianae TaxID=2782607 RepID=A0A9X1DDM2_9SPHN|nr:LysE family transporter [Sphingobium nicotianae]MBT2187939.1 LysE family transporter [Sphingobium nicotianae]
MIDWTPLFHIAVIFALGVISPGPNFLVVAQRAMLRGRTEAFATVAGVATVSMMWAAASLFGLTIIFKLFPWTHLVLRIAGASYLVWAGIKLWLAASKPPREAPAGQSARRGLIDAYRAGLATNLSNAKAIAFYSSAFSAAAPAPDKTATLWAALVLVLILVLSWYGTVVMILATGPLARSYRRGRKWIERVSGVLMIGFGVRLAASD